MQLIKKLLIITCCSISLITMIVVFNNITHPNTQQSESYEIQQAKNALTLSEIHRQAQDSAFRSAIVNVTMLLVVILIIALVITGLIIVLKVVGHWLEVDRWRRERERDTFQADRLGNYPAVILDNTLHQLTPGNSPVPEPAPSWVIGNSPVAKLPPGRARYDIPMLINTGGQRLATPSRPQYTFVQPEQIEETNERTFEANSSSEFPDYSEFSELLAQAKREGRGKNQSITAITGVAPGGSKAFRVYSEYWDNLQ